MLGFKMSSHKHAKAVWRACVEYHSFFRLNRSAATKSTSKQSKSYFTACTNTDQTTKEHEERTRKQFSKCAKIQQSIAENRYNEKTCSAINASQNGSTNGNGNGNGKLSLLSITKSYKTYDNKVTSKQMETIPRMAWEQQKYEIF